jgi:hypothetical protein
MIDERQRSIAKKFLFNGTSIEKFLLCVNIVLYIMHPTLWFLSEKVILSVKGGFLKMFFFCQMCRADPFVNF